MEDESKRIIFNTLKTPSPKSILVSFPMNMYRIKTFQFEYWLDFFQRTILLLKANPNVSDEVIATCLGLDIDLVKRVIRELQNKNYIDFNGVLTQAGKDKKNDIDGLVVNPEKEQLGYVLQFVDREDYYPYYITNLGEEPNMADSTSIIVGTKGDGADKVKRPFELSFINKAKRILPFPNERVLLDLIIKTSRKDDLFGDKAISMIRKSLSISYFQDTPEPIPVTVCTYLYLPKREDDNLYEPEWQILDPFGKGDSSQIKFYLESFNDSELKKEIEKRFGDAETLASKNFGEYSTFLTNELQRMKENDFGIEFKRLDRNLQQYLDSAIKNIFIFRQYKYHDFDSGDMFIISTQRALETLFLLDAERRSDIYDRMKADFSTPDYGDREEFYRKRRSFLKELTRNRLITMSDPERLIRLSKKVEPTRANSLKQYIYNLILTYNYDNQSPLFKLIDGHIEELYDIAELRNTKGHGQTESEGSVTMVTKDVAEKTYSFLQNFINTYMYKAL